MRSLNGLLLIILREILTFPETVPGGSTFLTILRTLLTFSNPKRRAYHFER